MKIGLTFYLILLRDRIMLLFCNCVEAYLELVVKVLDIKISSFFQLVIEERFI